MQNKQVNFFSCNEHFIVLFSWTMWVTCATTTESVFDVRRLWWSCQVQRCSDSSQELFNFLDDGMSPERVFIFQTHRKWQNLCLQSLLLDKHDWATSNIILRMFSGAFKKFNLCGYVDFHINVDPSLSLTAWMTLYYGERAGRSPAAAGVPSFALLNPLVLVGRQGIQRRLLPLIPRRDRCSVSLPSSSPPIESGGHGNAFFLWL